MSNSLASILHKSRGKSPAELVSLAFVRGRDRAVLAAYRLRYPQVKFGTGVAIRGKLIIRGKGKVHLGDFVSIHGLLTIDCAGEVHIGDHIGFTSFRSQTNRIAARNPDARVVIGSHSFFNGAEVSACTKIEFKHHCIVSDSLIEDDDYHSIEINRWDPGAVARSRPISIGKNVWIGSRAVVLKGVTIGDNSVVGLATIVRKPVPANCVVIGNPQQIVKWLDTSIAPYASASL